MSILNILKLKIEKALILSMILADCFFKSNFWPNGDTIIFYSDFHAIPFVGGMQSVPMYPVADFFAVSYL
jgi:hypothetical protein